MRKVTRLFLLLALVLMSAPAFTQPGTCEPGGIFRDSHGEMIDCIQGYGDNCLACTFIYK
ncbi:MAG TPA: hypothetical protein VM733_06215 [Thermoanaerobaculia bacterium]|nr:hypothetical protein [Thermoanaerobaculia bacterium]